MLLSQVPSLSSLLIELYIPKYFFAHAASLHQAFAHCAIFPTAASRRSLGRVSVPMWPVALSGRLLIVGLVGLYPANCLIRRGSISHRRSFLVRYSPFSSLTTGVYNPKTFFLHAASLHQGFPHCAISPTAASRRSLGRVSVPMWPFNLSVRLLIVALVSRYLTN